MFVSASQPFTKEKNELKMKNYIEFGNESNNVVNTQK